MFRISHETPLELLEVSRTFNDYDYALVHLFGEHSSYLNFFKESLAMGRTVILDNSAYELGRPYGSIAGEDYKKWIKILKPTEYILPDFRNDSKKNYKAISNWNCSHKAVKIGVVHGNSYADYCANYTDILPFVDKIAFSVEDFFFENQMAFEETRPSILSDMLRDGIIDTSIPHHILGALSPTEYKNYVNYSWIESVDTSNPVLHGLLGQRYEGSKGLESKSSVKINDIFEDKVSISRLSDVQFNVSWFRKQFEVIETSLEKYDEVKADHYRKFPIETIELMERVWGRERTALWCEMTAFKYRMRLGHKPSADIKIDLQKEEYYLNKAKELRFIDSNQ